MIVSDKRFFSKFFNLEVNPFGETPDPDFYYASLQHNRAISQLDAALRQGRGFSLLTGEVGTGKTLLSRLILSAVSPYANTALLLYPKFTEIELLQAISEEFEVPAPNGPLTTAKAHVDHLNCFLLASAQTGRRSILMIDEAQSLGFEALESIRLLTNLETKTQKLLQVVLIAQPELNETLDLPELRQLKQRVGIHAKIEGLDVIEVERYIKTRIEVVGNGNFIRFDSSAVKLIHSLTLGIPRRINQVCGNIIMHAESKRVRLITSPLCKEALEIKPRNLFSILTRKER